MADEQNDAVLDMMVNYANVEVDKILIPFADTTPIEAGTDLFNHAKQLALLYAHMRWYRYLGQIDRAGEMQDEIMSVQKTLTDTLVANRTTRTARVVIARDPTLDRIPTPAARDTFIEDYFEVS